MVSGGCIGGIWMVSLDVCGVRMCLNGCLGAHPLQGGEFTLFWHSPERQDFFHLAILRHQNIKMSTYILNKNGWVLPFFSFLVPVREKLKNTVTWITLYHIKSQFTILRMSTSFRPEERRRKMRDTRCLRAQILWIRHNTPHPASIAHVSMTPICT